MGAHLLWEQGGGGSNPPIPTSFAGSGLVAKARVSGTRQPGFESLLPDQIIAGEWNGQPREPHKLEDNGFDSRARYQVCPRRLAAGFLILSQETRIRLPPRVRSVRGVRPSSVPCHGTDHGFKSRTDRQILWPVRLSVGWLIFIQSRRVRLPHRLPKERYANHRQHSGVGNPG